MCIRDSYWALPVTPNSSTDTLVVSATLTSVGKKTAQSEGWQLRLDCLLYTSRCV